MNQPTIAMHTMKL